MKNKKKKKIVITSGYWNPLHIGHVNLIKDAKNFGDFLVVIVNNDEQVKIKGSVPFMPEQERIEIVKALRYVDDVLLSVDKDRTVAESLKLIAKKHPNAELFFAKGGDRNAGNIPENETKVCIDFKITIVNDIGGGKVQSSSWLLENVKNHKK